MATLTMGVSPLAAAVAPPQPDWSQAEPSPGIVGYGGNTVGGRTGRVIWVTNLRDHGPGSLRAAMEARGRRIVQFRRAGTIVLDSPINVRAPYLTVAGHHAAENGVQIRGAPIRVMTHDVILKHLRVRLGDRGMSRSEAAMSEPLTLNAIGGRNVYNVVLDHLSLTWGPDIGGLAMLGNVHHVTVQNSILGLGLRYSRHPEGRSGNGHSMAVNLTSMRAGEGAPSRITFFHNLLTSSDRRMPRFVGSSCVDFVNNLVYNWGNRAASGEPRSLNLIGNWFRSGPLTWRHYIWTPEDTKVRGPFADSVYLRDNLSDGFAGRRYPHPRVYASSPRCGGSSVEPTPVESVKADVLTQVGAIHPIRDTVDRQVIHNVRMRGGRYFNGVDFRRPHPYWPPLTL